MKSSGKIREFPTGATRDSADNKPRMELLPYDCLERVAFWYGEGAKKYGDNNWRKGQPNSQILGSLLRHISKYMKGMEDEDHLSAIVWNGLALINNDLYYKNNPKVNDNQWFTNNVPNGKGSYDENSS